MLFIFSVNALKNSVLVAYGSDMSVEIGLVRRTVLVLCALRRTRSFSPTDQSHDRSMSKQLVAHVRPEFLCNVEERVQRYLLPPLVCGISE
jgi:hypothetical protein